MRCPEAAPLSVVAERSLARTWLSVGASRRLAAGDSNHSKVEPCYNRSIRGIVREFREPMTMAMPLSLETAEYEFLVSPLTSVQGLPTEPTTLSVKVRFGAVSDAGRVRPRNEDHYMVARVRRTFNVLAHNLPKDEMPDFLGEDA